MYKDFWKRLCEEFDYRFFSGVPFNEVSTLLSFMDPSIMHYIPAANESIAVKLASGASMSGLKSGAIISPNKLSKLDLSFNVEYKIPIMLLTTVGLKGFYSNKDINKVTTNMDKNNLPVILILEQ